MTNIFEHKIIKTSVTTNIRWRRSCISCGHKFDDGEERHEWRMRFIASNLYLSGSFWTIHCEECYIKTIIQWRDSLDLKINEIPPNLRIIS